PTVTAAPTETPAPAEQEPENSVEYAIKISTSYGDLYYPDQWEDYIKTEQTREGNILVVSFSAEIKGRTFRMFDARIGDNDAIGTLTGPDGKTRNVGFASYETENAEGLSADEQNRLNAMSEDINFVIDHLQ
ncbi:MAG: hypothetical protein Q4B09_11795, partial [Lachnospiraceae bacterium]|nr:hypothetical protein [Lachnospiraceae bacterium]